MDLRKTYERARSSEVQRTQLAHDDAGMLCALQMHDPGDPTTVGLDLVMVL